MDEIRTSLTVVGSTRKKFTVNGFISSDKRMSLLIFFSVNMTTLLESTMTTTYEFDHSSKEPVGHEVGMEEKATTCQAYLLREYQVYILKLVATYILKEFTKAVRKIRGDI